MIVYDDVAKKMLGEIDFLNKIRTLDKEKITEKTIKDLQQFITNERFDSGVLQSVNKVAANMALWVKAMDKFYHVNLVVIPKKEQLAIAEAEFEEVNAKLNVKKESLRKVQEQVDSLRRQLKNAQDEKQYL